MAERIIPKHKHAEMAERYRSGVTLAEVGAEFGVTRERARQILRRLGVERIDGGTTIRIFKETQDRIDALRAKNERQEARCREIWGMSLEDFKAHVAEHGSCTDTASPMAKYRQHRSNARVRGIAWNFTFPDWWRAWQNSGKWEQRGRGVGYVMARYGDGDAPYSAETVYICTQSQNSKDSFIVSPAAVRFAGSSGGSSKLIGSGKGWTICKKRKSNPYIAQIAGKQIGAFPTAELARAAYLEAAEKYKAEQAQGAS